ncbi:MAG: tyrosine-type recombinase/integrase [Synergistaceae bacterium]|nr:tyrosine-type recombinase/integrase [Synergistaceae bacterium]
MNDLLDAFFRFIDVSEKTEAIYRRALRRLFGYFTSNAIIRPSRDDILNFRRHLERLSRKPSTIALYLSVCRRFFTWTAHTGLYPNIAFGIKTPKQEPGHKRDYLCAGQLRKILHSIDRSTPIGRRNFAVIALMAAGGLRTIEVSRANIEDFRKVGRHTCLFIQGKGRNSKSEFVKVPAPVSTAICEYLRERGQVNNTAPLFASMSYRNMNGRLSARSISFICKSAMQENGFTSNRLTAHSLRHSAITIALSAGISLSEVQAFARHKSITSTMIYAHHVDRLNSTCEDTVCSAIF